MQASADPAPRQVTLQDAPELAWPGLADALARLNAWVAPRRLRQWQADLLARGTLELPDPSGATVACSGTIYSALKAFAYRFETTQGVAWLLTGPCRDGYELAGLLLPGAETLLRFPQFEEPHCTSMLLKHLLPFRTAPGAPGPVPARLVAGHGNFAHFMWNELPALMEAAAHGMPGVAEIIVTHEPFGPLDRLLRLQAGPPCRVVLEHQGLRPEHGLHHAVLFACGSTRMDRASAERIVAVSGGPAPRDLGRFTLWLSFRSSHRTATNQLDLFAALVTALTQEGPIEIISDGFSLPLDAERFGADMLAYWQRQAAVESEAAAALVARVPAHVREQVRWTDATRLDLNQAIALAGRADAYLCHQGTQQHKIGWLYPTPGLIHAPPMMVRAGPASWTQDQSEVAALPTFLPEPLVEDVVPGATDTRGSYRFGPIPEVVEFIRRQLRPVIRTKLGR